MRSSIDGATVIPATRALLGAIDVDGGATDEQLRVLTAIVTGYLGRADLRIDTLTPLDPAGAADAMPDAGQRRQIRELMVLLEMCRHPISAAQVDRVDDYAAALEQSDAGLEIVRDLVRAGAEAATVDYFRFLGDHVSDLAEPSLGESYPVSLTEPDPELAGRLRSLHDLPVGTLGHEFVEFHRRNSFELPGDSLSFPAVFVSHDMSHVIGGYEPTGQEEIALGAMQLAMSDNDGHWVQFLGNLAVHEAGYLVTDGLVARCGALARDGAADMLAEALARGARCTGDFTSADHLAMAEWPLEEVRTAFGVPPRAG